jgi:16S rRNA C967 or C1407 C5-methylase (RsmB/RsmF family)
MLKDVCAYFGYSEFLADKLMNLFPAREAFAFFEANETPRPIVIRTNTLRSHRRELAQALINRGVQLEPVGKWSKVGLQVRSRRISWHVAVACPSLSILEVTHLIADIFRSSSRPYP